MKRLVFMSILFMVTLGLFANGNGDESAAADSGSSDGVITFYYGDYGGRSNKPDNGIIQKEIESQAGVTLEIKSIPQESFIDKLNLIIASGEVFDVISKSSIHWTDYKARNAIMPLSDLFANEGKSFADKIGKEAFVPATDGDGEIWAIPAGSIGGQKYPNGTSLGIRSDWLEQLDMDAPSTRLEFEQLLEGIKNTDLNGNGDTSDEIPFMQWPNRMWEVPLAYFTGFGGYKNPNYLNEDGEVLPIYAHPGYKEMVRMYRDWYEKGYFHPEFFALKNEQINNLLINDRIGTTMQWYSNSIRPMLELQKSNPNANYDLIPMWTDAKAPGIPAYFRGGEYQSQAKISATSDNPKDVMKYLNWFASTPEAGALTMYGVEGTHFEWADKAKGLTTYLERGTQENYDKMFWVLFDIDYRDVSVQTDATNRVSQEYQRFWERQGSPDFNIIRTFDDYVPYSVEGTEAEFLSGEGMTLIEETRIKIIIGEEPLEYWDEAVTQYMEIEGDILSKVRTKQYNTFIGK